MEIRFRCSDSSKREDAIASCFPIAEQTSGYLLRLYTAVIVESAVDVPITDGDRLISPRAGRIDIVDLAVLSYVIGMAHDAPP